MSDEEYSSLTTELSLTKVGCAEVVGRVIEAPLECEEDETLRKSKQVYMNAS